MDRKSFLIILFFLLLTYNIIISAQGSLVTAYYKVNIYKITYSYGYMINSTVGKTYVRALYTYNGVFVFNSILNGSEKIGYLLKIIFNNSNIFEYIGYKDTFILSMNPDGAALCSSNLYSGSLKINNYIFNITFYNCNGLITKAIIIVGDIIYEYILLFIYGMSASDIPNTISFPNPILKYLLLGVVGVIIILSINSFFKFKIEDILGEKIIHYIAQNDQEHV